MNKAIEKIYIPCQTVVWCCALILYHLLSSYLKSIGFMFFLPLTLSGSSPIFIGADRSGIRTTCQR